MRYTRCRLFLRRDLIHEGLLFCGQNCCFGGGGEGEGEEIGKGKAVLNKNDVG